MERLIGFLEGIGVPLLILSGLMSLTGLSGTEALTATLQALGPGGALGGIGTLLGFSILAYNTAESLLVKFSMRTVRAMIRKGVSPVSIRDRIRRFPVSGRLKRQLEGMLLDSLLG